MAAEPIYKDGDILTHIPQTQVDLLKNLGDTKAELQHFRNEVSQRLDRLESDVSGLKTDVSGLKTDMSGLKTDYKDMKKILTLILEKVS